MFRFFGHNALLLLLSLGSYAFKLFQFVLLHLFAIHNGTMVGKFKSTMMLSIIFGTPLTISDFFFEWIDLNGSYVGLVVIAIFIDWILGTFVHLTIKRDFSFKKNATGVMLKLLLVICVGVLFEGFTTIYGEDSMLTDSLTIVTRLMVFLYPAGSAFMNCAVLTNGAFPPIGLFNFMKKFNTSLKIDSFQTLDKDE